MKTQKLHSWARQLQVRLAGRVQFTALESSPTVVAGLDCAFSKDGRRIFAGVVVLRLPDFEILETSGASRKVTFPYIPGLLSFREAPVCIAAVEKLRHQADLFMVDGQGIAHPRRLGLAAHLGLFFARPTIGCAKSRLTGAYEEPPLEKGAYSLLKDITNIRHGSGCESRAPRGQTLGAVVRTRTNVKPVFVSVGNKCLLDDAIEITLACATRYRLPEPTRLAHQLVSKLKLNI
ncbi:MAG: endonuclease V [Planctomycetota bacterium]|jgi:deoxyribonuclease V